MHAPKHGPRFFHTGKTSTLLQQILDIVPLEGPGVTIDYVDSLLPEYERRTIRSALSELRQAEQIERVGGNQKNPLLRRTY